MAKDNDITNAAGATKAMTSITSTTTNEADTTSKAEPIEVKLSDEVAKKYELVNWTGSHKQLFGRHGIIDITTLTLARAEKLEKAGWPKLKKK